MSIAEFCNREVVCATRDTTILEAANLMRRHHVGDIIIVDEDADRRWPIGIVTDRDIVVESSRRASIRAWSSLLT